MLIFFLVVADKKRTFNRYTNQEEKMDYHDKSSFYINTPDTFKVLTKTRMEVLSF